MSCVVEGLVLPIKRSNFILNEVDAGTLHVYLLAHGIVFLQVLLHPLNNYLKVKSAHHMLVTAMEAQHGCSGDTFCHTPGRCVLAS